MKNKKTASIIKILVLILIASATIGMITLWKKPFSTKLTIPTLPANAPAAIHKQTLAATLEVTNTPVAVSTSQVSDLQVTVKEPVCDGPERMIILAVGIDYQSTGNDYLYGLGDVIRIVRIDFTVPSVSVLAVPRDLRVYIPGLENMGIDYGKINQAYFWGTPGMGYYHGKAGGAGLLADTLYYNFGLYPDHYGVVSMSSLEKMINAVGGIDVNLDYAVDGNINGYDLGFYGIGAHHFDGATAIKFGRIREGYSDLNRIDNQTVVINALYTKMMTDEVRPDLIGILTNFILRNDILTDFSPAELPLFMCVAQQIEHENIKFVTLPSETFKADMQLSSDNQNYAFYFIPDLEKMNQVFDAFKQGIWP